MVLGMHRSGTSAVSLSLRVFGARHGDRLVGGLSSNPKGHWEDIDVLRLNERMFEAIHTRWDSPSPVTPRDVRHLAGKGFVGAAAGLLRDKIAANGFYAVKDPRMTKPFRRRKYSRIPSSFSAIPQALSLHCTNGTSCPRLKAICCGQAICWNVSAMRTILSISL